jgi:hypothetical protein
VFYFTLSGRVGAINLEQLDALLDSLKTYWDYSKSKLFLADLKLEATQQSLNYELAYEL